MQLYLDSAGTTKVKPEVLKAMMPYLTDEFYNPSSIYSEGVRIRRAIDNARESIASFINADTDEIFFHQGRVNQIAGLFRAICLLALWIFPLPQLSRPRLNTSQSWNVLMPWNVLVMQLIIVT